MRKYLYIFFLFTALTATAQKTVSPKKAYKPVRTALKAGKATDALTAINKLAADSVYCGDPKLYAYGIDAEQLLCESYNEKMYLSQKIDTAQFFAANYELCRFILRCDTAELKNAATQGRTGTDASPLPYRRQNRHLLQQYYPNLSAAARFHYAKRQYAEARRYFAYVFGLPRHAIWGGDTAVTQTKTYHENRYLDFRCMYELKQYADMPACAAPLLADSALHQSVLDMLVTAARERGDSADYIRLVRQGLDEQPGRMEYFAVLANYFTARGLYGETVAMTDTLLVRDPMNRYYLLSRCLALFDMGRLDDSKVAAERLLSVDSTAAEAHYILGYYYFQQAEAVELPRQTRSALYRSAKQRQADLYAEARPHVEQFRQAMPEEQERWAPMLYKIYLNLNLGREFEEIERLIGGLPLPPA
ncbi:MAG: hypothetical protein J6M53_09235 [Bacteroidaceae bacterium]|nr:hypothetical protein [Bacteroidaceae bacterium]